MVKIKRRLTHTEEFDIMKLVLDKFLWLGTAFIGWGLYKSITTTFQEGVWFIGAGAVIMLLFAWIIIREFEQLR
ncbi:MAG: hypothetical protein QXR48_01395 [Candidatus Woesearchaeota archaeon]